MFRYLSCSSLLLVLLFPTFSIAQVDSVELEKRWNKKQQSSFLKFVSWERSLDSAKERASRDNRPIVAYFTRSYAP